jgi:hypothetical protein
MVMGTLLANGDATCHRFESLEENPGTLKEAAAAGLAQYVRRGAPVQKLGHVHINRDDLAGPNLKQPSQPDLVPRRREP